MKGPIAWFAQNPVAANVLMVSIVAFGLTTLGGVRQEVVPTIQVDSVQVTVPYPGASPEEVEESICMRIEEAVQGLAGVDRVTASANENFGAVSVSFLESVDRNAFLDEVKAEVDRIDNFPEDAEEPTVALVEINQQVLEVVIWGNADPRVLRQVAEKTRANLQALNDVTLVRLNNAAPLEIAIEVDEIALQRHHLSFDQITAAVRRSSLDLPGGSLRTAGGEILVRAKGQAYQTDDFAQLPLQTFPDGTRLLLGEVATIRDGFAETDQSTRFNGSPAVLLSVFRVGDQSAIEIAKAARGYLEQAEAQLTEGLHLTVFADDTRILNDRIGLMMKNGKQGLVLVLLCLSLFLRMRLALWVTAGIPIALLGSVALMPGMDVSINLISLLAFIVVLGIVVDDAIVVAENIHRHRLSGKSGMQAAIDGTREVSIPVVFAVLTTIVAFMPMLFMPGTMGQFSRNVPLVVLGCLAFSLVESLLVLPAHLTHLPREGEQQGRRGLWSRVQDGVDWLLRLFIRRVYEPFLDLAVRWRYATVGAGLVMLLISAAYVGSGRIKFNFFPSIEADNVAVELTMPLGTPLAATENAVLSFEQAARQLQQELRNAEGEPLIRNIATSVGGQPYRAKQSAATGGAEAAASGAHLAEVNLELLPAEDRTMSSVQIAKRWAELAGPVPGAEEIAYNSDMLGSDGDIDLRLTGPDLADLQTAAAELVDALKAQGGVLDASDSFRAGKREWKLSITPAGEALGLTLADLARQVRQALYGEEIQTIQRGRNETEVVLRYSRAQRSSAASLENMRVRTLDGRQVPFATVAAVESGRGYSTIERISGRRSIRVSGHIDKTKTTPDQVTDKLRETTLADLQLRFPGLAFEMEGRQKQQTDFMARLVRYSLLSLLGIFALLAIPLKSYLQPLIIMSAIPFGLVGAVWGHVILGADMAIMSMIGLAALSGVVINDSLVMIDFVNRFRREGASLHEAVMRAGSARFRAILLTSVTTFAGLTPLLLERSLQAQFLIPMGISLAFGVLFATFITLVLVPSLYTIVEDLIVVLARIPGVKGRLTNFAQGQTEGGR